LVFIILLAWFNIPKLRFAIAAFSAPFVFANLMLLTPDIAVNHKYIMMSVMLLNIAAAAWLSELPHCDPKSFMNRTAVLAVITGSSLLLFPELSNSTGTAFSYYIIAVLLLTILYSLFNKYRKQLSLLVTAMLIFLMSCTGIVDLISFYNINKNSVKYNLNDPLLKWVEQNTDKNDLFLTPPYVTNPIMLAGRKIYLGWPYFPWSAGYDTDTRGKIVNEIYGGTNIDQIKKLIHEAGIDYIVIENENRNSKDYKLNEMLFENHFEKVYYDPAANYIIYKAGPI